MCQKFSHLRLYIYPVPSRWKHCAVFSMHFTASGPVTTWGLGLFVHCLLAWIHPELFPINLSHATWSSFCTVTRGEGTGSYGGQHKEARCRVDIDARQGREFIQRCISRIWARKKLRAPSLFLTGGSSGEEFVSNCQALHRGREKEYSSSSGKWRMMTLEN